MTEELSQNPYLQDILSQPQALRQTLALADTDRLETLRQALWESRFDRIVLTGMGASFYGLYPAWLHLAAAGLPAIWVDAAELVHHTPGLVGRKTLLWVASQSGQSAEIVALLRQSSDRPPMGLLALTNELSSPLAQAAGQAGSVEKRALLPLNAAPERTPSTRTYLHTLALGQLGALYLAGADLSPHRSALLAAADGIEAYLQDWQGQMQRLGEMVERGASQGLYLALVGRGPSLTSALVGALNLQEAAKLPALGLQAAEFRHGPLEMAGPGLTVLVFAGERGQAEGSTTEELSRKLWRELCGTGANAWLLQTPSPPVPLPRRGEGGGQLARAGEVERVLDLPAATGAGLPLAEIIPVQLLCVYLSQRAGITPGTFRHIGKVTVEE